MPTPLVLVERTNLLVWLVATTVAPGITAPVESATVPLRVAEVTCVSCQPGQKLARISIDRLRRAQVALLLCGHDLKAIRFSIQPIRY